MHVGSTATTNLTIQPQRELSGSITRTRKVVDHYATRKIYDTRQVFTGRYNKVYVGKKMVKDGYEWKTRTVTKERWVRGHYETGYHLVWKPIKVWGVTIGHYSSCVTIGRYPSYESYQKWVPWHWESYTATERYKSWNYKPVKQYRKKPIYRTERYVKRTERYPVYRRQKYTASTSESIHTITVTATDDYGREKQANYYLNLQTSEKPPVENTILSVKESDIKPPEHGSSVSNQNVYGGVAGKVKSGGIAIRGATVKAWEDGSYIGSKSSYSDGRYYFQRAMGRKDSNGNYYGVNPTYRYKVRGSKPDYSTDYGYGTWRRSMEDCPVKVNLNLLPEGSW